MRKASCQIYAHQRHSVHLVNFPCMLPIGRQSLGDFFIWLFLPPIGQIMKNVADLDTRADGLLGAAGADGVLSVPRQFHHLLNAHKGHSLP